MTDSILTSIQDAKTIVLRAMLRCPAGEARARMEVAHGALLDALEQRQHDVERPLLHHHRDLSDGKPAA